MGSTEGMKRTVLAASYNMILQMIFRVGTFVMNAVLMRYITKEMLGIVNVRLILLHSTINFISREAFRKACLSRSAERVSDDKRKKMVNLIWVCVIIGLVTSVVLTYFWIWHLEQPSPELVRHYRICSVIFAATGVLELFAEPLWIFGQSYSFVVLKVMIDGASIVTRCLISVAMVILFPQMGLLSFGVGFFASSFVYTVTYYIYFANYVSKKAEGDPFPFTSIKDFLPDFSMGAMFDPYYTNLVTSFYKQSLIKQFLTEGERYIMTLFNILSFGEQGVYDVINNLGSLAARIIFMPIEESYYVFYSLLLTRGKPGNEHPADDTKMAARSLSQVLKVVSIIGCIILVFGFSYSYLLLQLYGGNLLTDNEGPILLRTYCLYVLVIAVNGITECFMFAGMHQTEVDRYNFKMFIFSVIFLVASLLLTRYFGAVGFILANCVNMFLRISHSFQFIWKFFKDTEHNPLLDAVPSTAVFISLAVSWCVTYLSERTYCCSLGFVSIVIHIGIGAVCLLLVLMAIFLTEHDLSSLVTEVIMKKREGRTKTKTE